MKFAPIKILQITIILIAVGVSFIPHVSSAAGWLEGPAVSVVNTAISIVANWVLGLTSTLVLVAGIFLSMSINLTTHIGDFYNSIPALNDVWVVVRNISSMFIIFALLYTSISTILGVGKNVKELIGKIIIVGLLINFSLFFCKILIDASNLVSLQFYRAIAPQYQVDGLSKVSSAYYDGGLSNVFMNSLKIPKIYQNQDILKSADVTLSITFATVGGVIMMVTAAISFFAAAIAFTIRTGLLLFVMALSPLYFAAMIFPAAKEKADELLKIFKGQLIFMPAYLFLMYIALRLISSPGFSAIFNQNATGVAAPNEGAFGPTFVGVIIQYIIALFFINAPLLMAIKMGASGAGWAPDMNSVTGWFKKGAQGSAGATWRNTGSRIASRVAQSETVQRFAGSSFAGEQLRRGMLGVARGYDENLGRRIANREATYNSLNDSRARTNYSGRLTNSIFTRSGQISMATTGRADRVGAARILTRRQTEITAEINRLVTRERQLQAIIAGNPGNNIPPRNLTQVEQAELDAINGTPGNPGDLATENANLATIQGQIRQFQLNTGGSQVPGPVPPGRVGPPRPVVSGGSTPRQVNRRNY